MEIIGWIGALCFSLCALPQSIMCYKQGHAKGLSWAFLLLWMVGEILTIIYVVPKGHLPLIANYVINLALLQVMVYYKIWPRKESE